MTMARQTTNHTEIRHWIEKRNGQPSKGICPSEDGVLGVNFNGGNETLKPIGWAEFFRIFEGANLAFLCQDKTGNGGTSHFNKFVERE